MRKTSSDSVFKFQPPLDKKDWPYKSKVAAHKTEDFKLEPTPPDPDKCPECLGRGVIWKDKHKGTGSKRATLCGRCHS